MELPVSPFAEIGLCRCCFLKLVRFVGKNLQNMPMVMFVRCAGNDCGFYDIRFASDADFLLTERCFRRFDVPIVEIRNSSFEPLERQ
jgi:hypothetical protein